MQSTALKAAKKTLKSSGPMKLKELAKTVSDKIQNNDVTSKQVRTWIQQSTKFQLEGKVVSLTRKRARSPKDPQEELAKAQKKHKTSDAASVAAWRQENKIIVMHDDENKMKELNENKTYNPYSTFDQCRPAIAPALIDQCVKVNGFVKPSPIQAQAWPILSDKRDVVGIAETGSGKTLAFCLPALSAISANNNNKSRSLPRMLVLSPTRELAMQSDQVLQEFGQVVGLGSIVLYGGVPKHNQTAALRKQNIHCIVATPGRLKDLILEGSCDLSAIEYLVLDEADRMVDIGFEKDVRFIISQCRDQRQTAMFSATWPAAIQNIAMDFMVDPVRIYVGFDTIAGTDETNGGGVDDSLSANKRVVQTVQVIEDRQREAKLRQILNKVHTGKNRVLVFALYKKEAERLEYSLRRQGWNCCSIHGNKNQAARTAALSQFKDGSCPLMIATDVAARGLDIPNVEVVINYTFPLTIEDYVHRIGRTGRAGKTGQSITFFQPTDKSHAGELQQVMKQAGQDVPEALMKFGSTIKKKEHHLYGNFAGPRDNGLPMKKATKIRFDY